MKQKSSHKNKIYRVGKFIFWGGLCVALAMGGLKFLSVLQQEKINALSMQAMLVNIIAVEDAYEHKMHHYTDQWEKILPVVSCPKTLEVTWAPLPQQPTQYRIGFGEGEAEPGHGYVVSLLVDADGKDGKIVALRQNGWFQYRIERTFQEGETQCINLRGSKFFCKWFEKNTAALEPKNWIPMPKKESENEK